jgi:hypothetical protein
MKLLLTNKTFELDGLGPALRALFDEVIGYDYIEPRLMIGFDEVYVYRYTSCPYVEKSAQYLTSFFYDKYEEAQSYSSLSILNPIRVEVLDEFGHKMPLVVPPNVKRMFIFGDLPLSENDTEFIDSLAQILRLEDDYQDFKNIPCDNIQINKNIHKIYKYPFIHPKLLNVPDVVAQEPDEFQVQINKIKEFWPNMNNQSRTYFLNTLKSNIEVTTVINSKKDKTL